MFPVLRITLSHKSLFQFFTYEILQDLQVKSQPIQAPVTPIIQTPPTPQVSSNIVLKSAKGVDYSKLEQLLKSGKWKEADRETARVMCQAANRVWWWQT